MRIFKYIILLLLTLSLLLAAFGCAPVTETPDPEHVPTPEPEVTDPTTPEGNTPTTPENDAPQLIRPTGSQPSTIVSTTEELQTTMNSLFNIPAFTDVNGVNCRIMQGGCTDGTYYYVTLNDGYSENATSISAIRKYDIASGKLLATFEGLQICHCNDMTYNPNTNELFMVHNTPERWVISVFDGDSLEFKKKIEILREIYSLSYDPYENCYWAGLSYGYDFIKMDTDFNQIGEDYTGVVTGYTKQGMDVDDKYIYFLQFNKNSIIVYNKSGQFIREIALSKTSYEAENIFHIGETFYIGYYNSPSGGNLFKTELSVLKQFKVEATMTQLAVLDRYTDADSILYKVPQGSCTDGTYIYLAMNNDVSSGYKTVIHKIDPKTGAVIDTSDSFSAGLSNDMTYNAKTKQIVIAHNKNEPRKLTVLDAETLAYVNTVTLSRDIFSITYDSVQDCYFAGLSGTYDVAKLNASFEIVETLAGYNSGDTKQGCDCDGTYLYCLQSATNSISIYKTNGVFVAHIDLPVVGENTAQSICHIGNTFYIGYNDSAAGGILYTATITIE